MDRSVLEVRAKMKKNGMVFNARREVGPAMVAKVEERMEGSW